MAAANLMNVSNIDFLLILGRAVFLVFSFALAATTFTAWRRATRAQTEQVLCQGRLLLDELAGIRSTLQATAHSVTQLAERIEHPTTLAAPSAGASPGYRIAIRLARGGASSEELICGCGLTRAEAELVRRLHGPSRPELRQVS